MKRSIILLGVCLIGYTLWGQQPQVKIKNYETVQIQSENPLIDGKLDEE